MRSMPERSAAEVWTRGLKQEVLVVGVVCVVVGYIAANVLGWGMCGGDGGNPYAAPDSPRGRFCEAGGDTLPFWGPLVALFAGVLATSTWRRVALLRVAFAVAVALLILPIPVAAALPNRCAGDDPAIDNDKEYPARANCDHY